MIVYQKKQSTSPGTSSRSYGPNCSILRSRYDPVCAAVVFGELMDTRPVLVVIGETDVCKLRESGRIGEADGVDRGVVDPLLSRTT